MSVLDTLQEALAAHGVRHFTAGEVLRPTAVAGGIVNGLPPDELLWRIIPTLHVLERLRARLGSRPIFVNSGWRSPAYNAAVGGSEGSLHMALNALDIRHATASPAVVATTLEEIGPADYLGIGIYRTFIHLDTRGLILGMPRARWEG